MMRTTMMALGMIVLMATTGTAQDKAAPSPAEREFIALHNAYLAKYKPLLLESGEAWWQANITGSDAAVARKTAADEALLDLHSDRATFAQLKKLRDEGGVKDPVLHRELDVLYYAFLANQADPALHKRVIALENELEQIFNNFRSPVGDKRLTENEVRTILASSKDSAAVEAAWKGYMEVGRQAQAKLAELVALRNEVARALGFKNFFSMNLALQEIDEAELFKLFDELDSLTRAPFAQLKAEIDQARATRFGLQPADLRPWHFGDLFFQEVPATEGVDFDAVFKTKDILELAKKYYASLGLPVDDILARSDLYEKPGKCSHAFCHDADRAGDIRVLANVQPNSYWADTMLHELGHGIYDKYIRPDMPFVLKTASHGITTEGIAEMFGAMSKNEEWLTQVAQVPPAEAARLGQAARKALRNERLMFCRWAQVMVRFERGMYSNPDQNLGKLWWDLKQQYQLLNPPESVDRPDYGAKNHILTTPVYYHCYMMGELFAAQIRHKLIADVLNLPDGQNTSFYNRPAAGEFLKEKVFGPGNLYSWNELTKYATGEPLTPKYFVGEVLK